jgi:hypothetical protein
MLLKTRTEKGENMQYWATLYRRFAVDALDDFRRKGEEALDLL